MKIALGQFAVRPDWQDNAAICLHLIARADAGGARLLVLPEGILARDIADPDLRAAPPSRWTAPSRPACWRPPATAR